jgi:hypothetical protein
VRYIREMPKIGITQTRVKEHEHFIKLDGVIMNWKIIKENQREYADTSYYLKAEMECSEGVLILEVCWIDSFMYNISVDLHRQVKARKSFFKKKVKPQLIFNCSVFLNDRIEKYGHQIMRITDDSPLSKFKRLDSFQKDGVLNWNLSERYNVNFETTLPEKEKD